MTKGYQALRESAALIDLSARGRIVVTGEDRVRLTHAMTTNHIEQLQPGQGAYTFFLNAQGRILADANILCYSDHLLIDTEPETSERIFQHLDKYIIADDAILENATGRLSALGVEGPEAARLLAGIGAPTPDSPLGFLPWNECSVAKISASGAPGYRIFCPASQREGLVGQLRSAGAVPPTPEDVKTVRLENARPRYGEDLTGDYIPHEAQLLGAVHFNKGCYLGQEIVERVRSRGQINKLLVPLQIEGEAPPPPGTKLTVENKEAGVVTSAAYSPSLGKVAALAYVRSAHAQQGSQLRTADAEATVSASSPTGP